MPEATTQTQRTGASTAQRRVATLQSRLDAMEQDAIGRLRRALGAGNEALHELDAALERVSKEDWTTHGLRKRIEELKARAENLRASAVKRVAEMPGSAVNAIASTSRVPVQNLARQLERMAKKLEPAAPAPAKAPAAEPPKPA